MPDTDKIDVCQDRDSVTVVIPAHNEQSTVGRLLDSLLEGGSNHAVQIIVVCNGCTDDTAEVARGYGVQVEQIPEASKVAALNRGDMVAKGYPRFYVDADVVLSGGSLRKIASVIEEGRCLAAAPRMQVDFDGCSWAVRAYYRVWMLLPYTREGMVGVGVYALSEQGRKRFDRFPDIIADDEYVRTQFKRSERMAVEGTTSVVKAPARLWDLIKIKTRSRLGGYQLKQMFPDQVARSKEEKSYGQAMGLVSLRPWLWPHALIYLSVNLAARWRARRQIGNLSDYAWERDESFRS